MGYYGRYNTYIVLSNKPKNIRETKRTVVITSVNGAIDIFGCMDLAIGGNRGNIFFIDNKDEIAGVKPCIKSKCARRPNIHTLEANYIHKLVKEEF